MRPRPAITAGLGLLSLALVACQRPPRTATEAYDRWCAKCHGLDGKGDPRTIGPNPHLDLTVSEMLARGETAEIAQRIAEGKGRMPGYSTKLSPAEITALALYTRERFAPPASGPTPAPAEGR